MKTIKTLLMLTLLTCLAATAFAGNDDGTENSRAYIEKKFAYTLNGQLGVEMARLSKDTRFREELSADDTDLAELLMAIDEDFDIEVSNADWASVTTIGEAVDLIFNYKNYPSWRR